MCVCVCRDPVRENCVIRIKEDACVREMLHVRVQVSVPLRDVWAGVQVYM